MNSSCLPVGKPFTPKPEIPAATIPLLQHAQIDALDPQRTPSRLDPVTLTEAQRSATEGTP
jgi:hypothetical protein